MIKIALVGTGSMANGHARHFEEIRGCKVTACCDLDMARAESFAEKYNIREVYCDISELLLKSDIDAVSCATVDAAHAPVSIAALKAGKHVLCEKPLASSIGDARKMALAAKRAKVINMVNFSYRDAPAIQKAVKMIQSGELGRVRHIEARYMQGWLASKYWGDWRKSAHWLWRLSTEHGSAGVLGDVGVHIIDFASFPVGRIRKLDCTLKTLPKGGGKRIGKYTLDANDTAIITAEFVNGAMGSITTTRWATGRRNSVTLSIYCDKGAVDIDLDRSRNTLFVCRGKDLDTAEWKELRCPQTPSIYQRFIKGIKTGKNDQPDFARGLEVQKALDACLRSDACGKAVAV